MAHPESQKGCQAFPLWSNHHWLGLLDGYRHRPHTEVQERPSQGWFSHTKCDSVNGCHGFENYSWKQSETDLLQVIK